MIIGLKTQHMELRREIFDLRIVEFDFCHDGVPHSKSVIFTPRRRALRPSIVGVKVDPNGACLGLIVTDTSYHLDDETSGRNGCELFAREDRERRDVIAEESEQLSGEILALVGEEAAIKLAENFGGCNTYIASHLRRGGEPTGIARAIGDDAARLLMSRFAGGYLRIPLMKELRAKHYRARGASVKDIAIAFCMTQTGVERLFQRIRKAEGEDAA